MGFPLKSASHVGWNSNGARSGLETGKQLNTVQRDVDARYEQINLRSL